MWAPRVIASLSRLHPVPAVRLPGNLRASLPLWCPLGSCVSRGNSGALRGYTRAHSLQDRKLPFYQTTPATHLSLSKDP